MLNYRPYVRMNLLVSPFYMYHPVSFMEKYFSNGFPNPSPGYSITFLILLFMFHEKFVAVEGFYPF